MSQTNVTLGQLFETIGRLHIQVEALQSEIAKRDSLIAGFMKEKEAQQASKVPSPEPHHGPFPPTPPPSPELLEALKDANVVPKPVDA